ncbi:MAG: cytochrome c peroxidase [Planctomycetota bacterium]
MAWQAQRLALIRAATVAAFAVPVIDAPAASPGVPQVAATAADYVGYSIDDLPASFRTPVLQGFDNTPADNPITNSGAELGRVLFYDARLSHNNGTACASCHSQATGFGDEAQLSVGFEGGLTGRHSMALANARFYDSGRFFWDERAATLEEQVLGPIQDAVEMGSNLTDLVGELAATEFYPVLFDRAFGDTEVTPDRISKALAQFVRSMVSYESPYDEAVAAGGPGRPNFAAVDSIDNPAQVQQGHQLFAGTCGRCHTTDAQVATDTHNIGLDAVDTDEGAGNGEFKTPSLRNAAQRGRFMHDGRFASLEEVVAFYSGGVQPNANRSPLIPPGGFRFTPQQRAALVAFLQTLSDPVFLSSELFSDPFVSLAGDYDGNGVVDMDDYAAWRAEFAEAEAGAGGPLYADGSGDGVVDAADYGLWRDNLGARWDDAWQALAAVVPEPGAVSLLAVAGSLAATRRRRRVAAP